MAAEDDDDNEDKDSIVRGLCWPKDQEDPLRGPKDQEPGQVTTKQAGQQEDANKADQRKDKKRFI